MSEPKYHEGQVVKIKSYAELKDNQLHILYTDGKLKEMAGAEVAIYKVLNDAGIILRYQVGQWGHNIIEIPEAYIKGEVSIGIDSEPGAQATFQTNDFPEFSNQLKYAVCNGKFPFSAMENLLKGCLADLEERKAKYVFEQTPLGGILRSFAEKMCSDSCKIDTSTFKLGQFVPLSDLSELKLIVDSLIVRNHLGNATVFIRRITPDGKENASETHFQKVVRWLETHFNLDMLDSYNRSYRSGVNENLGDIEARFSSLQTSIKADDSDAIWHNLIRLLSCAVFLVVENENPTYTENIKLVNGFYSVTNRMCDTYHAKQTKKEKGLSFSQSLDEFGLTIAEISIRKRVSLFESIKRRNDCNKEAAEALSKILIDIANHVVMTIMWIEDQTDKSQKE